jgi:alpha-glucosidase
VSDVPWWRDAICYQIYIRSFADSDGDGLGDLAGVRDRLPYLKWLGVDAIWLTPFYPSPQKDAGYDVSDYRDVDPRFGTLADFDAMLAEAHAHHLKVIVDFVPNHTSSEHPWFQAARADVPGGSARERYLFRDGRGEKGDKPPNNWKSIFGGSAWERVPDGQYYLHLFDADQPDLNWRNPEVHEEMDAVVRYWLDRGVDGLRIDVAHGLYKQKDFPNAAPGTNHKTLVTPYFDQPEVHDVYRRWHRILDEYGGGRMAIGEACTDTPALMAAYIRPDELQQAFNFKWLEAPWSAAAFRTVIEETYAAVGPVNASPTWTLSNHDVTREVTRYGGGAQGLARSRAANLAVLAMPGSTYIYQGAELGLPEAFVPEKDRQDPYFVRSGMPGRDGCRVPLPWSGSKRPYGFSPPGAKRSWLPQPREWAELSVEAQEQDPHSTLQFFRHAIAVRHSLFSDLDQSVRLASSPPGVLVVERDPGFTCVLNCGKRPYRLGDLGPLIMASGHDDQVSMGILPADTSAWFKKH